MEKITLVIEGYNAEEQLEGCIKSGFLLTKNILFINLSSLDKSLLIAEQLGVKTITVPRVLPVEKARNLCFQHSRTEWVMILDPDERMTEELAQEILKTISDNTLQPVAYQIPRKNIFAGKKWLRYGGWYPDYQTRLIKKSALLNWPSAIHSPPQIKGELAKLTLPFLHYFHPNLENMVAKTIQFEQQEASLLYDASRSASTKTFFRKFWGEFWRRGVLNMGWRDKTYGLIETIYQAYSKTITWLMLFEKQLNSQQEK